MATGSNNELTSETADVSMADKYRNVLRNVRLGLVKDMTPGDVLLNMSAARVFSPSDEEEIKAKDTREIQCETLLEILPRKGAKAYSNFVEALEKVQPHLANLIREAGKWV